MLQQRCASQCTLCTVSSRWGDSQVWRCYGLVCSKIVGLYIVASCSSTRGNDIQSQRTAMDMDGVYSGLLDPADPETRKAFTPYSKLGCLLSNSLLVGFHPGRTNNHSQICFLIIHLKLDRTNSQAHHGLAGRCCRNASRHRRNARSASPYRIHHRRQSGGLCEWSARFCGL